MNIMANLKSSVKQDKLIDMAMAAAAAVWARYVPTMAKLNGWAGFGLAYGVPILAGMLFNKPALTIAGIAIGTSHLTYQFTSNPNKNDDIWDLDPNNDGKIELLGDGMSGYGYNVSEITGEPVLSLSGYYEDANQVSNLEDMLLADNINDNGWA